LSVPDLESRVAMVSSGAPQVVVNEDGTVQDYRIYGSSIADLAALSPECPDLPVKFFKKLSKRIIELGGTSTSGIFRISAGAHDLAEWKFRLESRDTDFKCLDELDNVHIAANLMKKWLSELQDPVIPFPLYDPCITTIKESLARGRSADDPASVASFQELLSKLPPLNLEIIKEYIKLMKAICSTENVGTTLMNSQNLAVVTAPSLMRSPVAGDLQELLIRMRYEGEFAKFLIDSTSLYIS
jgi:hypothetical protein